jgi:aminoglycoside phosphotransferase (APT) family kinase protein
MDVERPVIDDTLVRRMVATQFPQWADLPVRSAVVGGWDNRSFHLGEHMIVRLASAADYSDAFGDRRASEWLSVEVVCLPMD